MTSPSRLAFVGGIVFFIAAPSVGCQRIVETFLGGGGADESAEHRLGDPASAPTRPPVGDPKQIPADFPKGVPLYPGAAVMSGITSDQPDETTWSVGLQTLDSAEKVVAFYKSQFAVDASDTNDLPNNPVAGFIRILIFENALPGINVSVAVQPNGGTTVQLSASKPKKK